MSDPIGAADAVVTAVDPDLKSPGIRRRDVVLVVGPWLAGTSSLIAALRERLPDHRFVEAEQLRPTEAPAAVVFVVSAMAPLTESDCALIDFASEYTDLVIGVVSKIDAHRNWRDVLAADRSLLAARQPRYEHVSWVGVAAAPDLGEPRLDDLVALLRQRLADPDTVRRNRLRAWESRLEAAIARYQSDSEGAERRSRVAALLKSRDDVARGRRLAKTERTIALRSQIQQARVQLGHFARNRCSSVRTELAEDISQLGRRKLPGFESYARERADEVIDDVDDGISAHLDDVAATLGLPAPPQPAPPIKPELPAPSLKSRRLETQLMMILGAGFGLGVALVVTRLFAGLAPALTVGGLVAGAVVGLALMVWVVGIRALLHDRAVLYRWVTDVMGRVRSAAEERVASRVLVAETALTSEFAHREEVESEQAAERVADIDAKLRAYAIETARATALRDRRVPRLQQALDAVRIELYPPLAAEATTNGAFEPAFGDDKSDISN